MVYNCFPKALWSHRQGFGEVMESGAADELTTNCALGKQSLDITGLLIQSLSEDRKEKVESSVDVQGFLVTWQCSKRDFDRLSSILFSAYLMESVM